MVGSTRQSCHFAGENLPRFFASTGAGATEGAGKMEDRRRPDDGEHSRLVHGCSPPRIECFFCRSCSRPPKRILLDRGAGNLDDQTGAEIHDLLFALNEKRSVDRDHDWALADRWVSAETARRGCRSGSGGSPGFTARALRLVAGER